MKNIVIGISLGFYALALCVKVYASEDLLQFTPIKSPNRLDTDAPKQNNLVEKQNETASLGSEKITLQPKNESENSPSINLNNDPLSATEIISSKTPTGKSLSTTEVGAKIIQPDALRTLRDSNGKVMPASSVGSPLSIKNLVLEALNYSPEIKGKQADNIAAGYDIDQVKGQRWPQVSVSGQSPMANIGGGGRSNKYSSDASTAVNVTTNLYDFGETSAKIKAAEDTEKSTGYKLQMTRMQIAGDLLQLLIQLSQYQEELSVAHQFSARMSKLTNMISEIVQSDQGRGSDLVQARARKVEADTNVVNIEKQLEDTQIAIIRLIGHRIHLPAIFNFNAVNIDNSNLDNMVIDHPKLKADYQDYQSSIHQADAANSAMYPRVNWVISKSTAKDNDGREDAWQTGINLQWDIFSGGSTRASANAALARANASKMALDTDRLEIENQLRNYAHLYDSGLSRAKEYAQLTRENDQVRDMFYQQWYYLGKRPLLDVLTAESSYFNNQITEIQTRYSAFTAAANYLTLSSQIFKWIGVNE